MAVGMGRRLGYAVRPGAHLEDHSEIGSTAWRGREWYSESRSTEKKLAIANFARYFFPSRAGRCAQSAKSALASAALGWLFAGPLLALRGSLLTADGSPLPPRRSPAGSSRITANRRRLTPASPPVARCPSADHY